MRRSHVSGGRECTVFPRTLQTQTKTNCLHLLPAEEERRVVGVPYESLVVMLNSVQHLVDSFAGLEKLVVDR